MSTWKPWHQIVELRDDLKSGELSLAIFAADLYDVIMGKAKPIYQDPAEFFALTYPTFALRELAKDVLLRLAGTSEKAIRQLELTYGGGKTHTLITLFHLVNDPANLPNLPAVEEFTSHIGITPPQARVATLTFDKLDVEKGMEVRSPDGELRWLKNPWSVLAFQLAGVNGLKLLNAEGTDAERESAPAENLLTDLLKMPQQQGLSTLILIDEVLIYAHEKVGLDDKWRSRLTNFFQYLTQAATKVSQCAIVASLLASDPSKNDPFGRELTQDIAAIFQRQQEERVQPVGKDDVAEVLRRRLFTPDSIRDRTKFSPQIVAALKGIANLDEQTNKEKNLAEQRFLQSYPFHPDLTEIFYTKWTQLNGFQRTRGVLRTFTLALRNAEAWDKAPLVGTNVFIGDPSQASLSEAARELTNIATTEEYEGKRQDWNNIIEGELAKARTIQLETVGIKHREIEQAVFATFLHSQPIGQKALTRDLLLLLGHTNPDKIELEKALRRWVDVSWFLDEEALQDTDPATGQKGLPKSWRLGSKPNLKQMHDDACNNRISDDLVEAKLLDEIRKLKSLTTGASAAGAKVHNLPRFPKDIEDDGDFHYGVLDPQAASTSGNPSAYASKFINETNPGAPRAKNRNAIVLAVPDRNGLDAARSRIRDYLGWEEVKDLLKNQEVDANRQQRLELYLTESKKKIPEAVEQAYCIVVTVGANNDIQAFKINVGGEPLFNLIKAEPKSRIQETAITAEAIIPGGAYDLWREDEPSRRVNDLVGAFAQRPNLPKMLNSKSILDTLLNGCAEGIFVLRVMRPDRTFRTFWRSRPDENALKDSSLEAVLPEHATLSDLSAAILSPGELPQLWVSDNSLTLQQIYDYFSGNYIVQIPRDGYEEPLPIPRVESLTINTAIAEAVQQGSLCLTTSEACFFAESIPNGVLTENAQLQPPLAPLSINDVLPENLPDAWENSTTTALAITQALTQKIGQPLPWKIVRDAIEGAFRAHRFELTPDSQAWPCEYSGAAAVKFLLSQPTQPTSVTPLPSEQPVTRPSASENLSSTYQTNASVVQSASNKRIAAAYLETHELQDLVDKIADIKNAAAGVDLKFKVQIELGGDSQPSDDAIAQINQLLQDISDSLEFR
ncbi:AAA family ATPase (plasmid) [Calothrix sp. NIES-2100]|uniref:DUF499 domain-containing protein n=1 Tax=Calothrix sp. NIES-2100 TaxID=1954172 RepID=UPI000B5DD816|nr:AAA family ATPase [Calothrix sp. NIES-2100]